MHPGSIDRALLLPKSGVGVVAPWLIMAPPGSRQLVSVDIRLLDRVELVGRADLSDESNGEGKGESAANSERLDLVLVCGDLEVALFIADGPNATRRIAEQAAVHTREVTKLTSNGSLEEFVVVDEDPVFQRGDFLQVGKVAFRIAEVRDHALRGANIPLTGGRLLQAAMAMLVIAAAERDSAST